MHDGKTSAIAKFLNLIGTASRKVVCPGKSLTSYIPNCTHICRRQNLLRRPMSVEIQVAYYIGVEGAIGKLQIVLVFLEHQFRL